MATLEGQVAVVTGAGGAIGSAIAQALAEQGATLCLVQHVRAARPAGRGSAPSACAVSVYEADLGLDADLCRLVDAVTRDWGGCDILVHSAGVITLGGIRDSAVDALDHQYRVNVRAPYVLSQAFLPSLTERRGQIVFVNSSAGLKAGAGIGQYAASKHALRALADSLREEVNADGVRVVSVYPGQTAGPLQETLYRNAGTDYAPERLLQPEDIAEVVITALTLPRTAEITDMSVRSMMKPGRQH